MGEVCEHSKGAIKDIIRLVAIPDYSYISTAIWICTLWLIKTVSVLRDLQSKKQLWALTHDVTIKGSIFSFTHKIEDPLGRA